jgi:signal transduction histidine kinase
MKRWIAFGLVAGLFCCGAFTSGTSAVEQARYGTRAEAKAMFDKAIAALKADKAKAIEMFNKADGEFRDRDLYVFCFSTETGIRNAHVSKSQIGSDIRLLKEDDGSPLGQKIFDAVKEGSVNTVQYNFPRPGTNVPVAKESFVTALGNQACGVGYYK